jgi:hypothetical protein
LIEIPKGPDLSARVDVAELGPPPALEEMQKLNATMGKVLEQLTRIQSWLVKIETNTRRSGFTP